MVKIAAGFIVLISVVFILILGKDLLIPFIFALIIWLLMRKVRATFDLVSWIKIYIPVWIKTILASAVLVIALIFLGRLIQFNIFQLEKSLPSNSQHLDVLVTQLNKWFPVTLDDLEQNADIKQLLGSYLSIFVNSLTAIVSNLFLILLYVIFLLLEESSFQQKLAKLFPKYTHHERMKLILDKIEHSLSNYIGLKSLLAFISAVLCGFTLYFMSVGAPIFWSLLIFLLYFIPTIGMFVSSALPALVFFITTGNHYFALTIFVTLLSIQAIVSNLLEVKIMGNSLNVSPLVTIIALVFWGSIWGLTGMILSVPITVIMVIVFSHFPETRSIAILLSEKGEIRTR